MRRLSTKSTIVGYMYCICIVQLDSDSQMARAHFRRSIFEHLLFGPPLWANTKTLVLGSTALERNRYVCTYLTSMDEFGRQFCVIFPYV